MRAVTEDVVVIGAGVCGLSAAVALLDAGLAVSVYTAEPPNRTTSAAAGALWGPHLVGADDRVAGWAEATLRRLRELGDEPAAGISEIGGLVASQASRRTSRRASPAALARRSDAIPLSFRPASPRAGGTPRP